MILPLPLVSFESYMLADDRPAYPMNILVRLRFSGRFDRAALAAAMSVAVARHPLLAAVARRSGRRWLWQPAEHPPALQWLEALPAEPLPQLTPLDARAASGIRLTACEGSGQTDIVLQVHHACCDGLGMLAVAEDLLGAYAIRRQAASATSLRPLAPDLLEGRGRFDSNLWQSHKTFPRRLGGLRGARRFLLRTPEPLVAHQPQANDSRPMSGYPTSLTRRLDESRTTEVLAAAKTLGVTLNDLLIKDLFLSLARWRQRHAPDRPDGWLRVCVPINLRTAAQDRLPAANVVSMVFLDRRGRDMKNPGSLLASVHAQMQRIKRLGLGSTFVRSLGMCQWLPGGIERRCRSDRCMSTVVFTNLGRVFDRCPLADRHGRVTADGLVLQDMDLLAPLRPLTFASFTTWTYAGRLCFTLHYDSRVLTAEQAGEIIDRFTESVDQSAGASSNARNRGHT
jgi:NRPS condensation-like uncharacterized protein